MSLDNDGQTLERERWAAKFDLKPAFRAEAQGHGADQAGLQARAGDLPLPDRRRF